MAFSVRGIVAAFGEPDQVLYLPILFSWTMDCLLCIHTCVSLRVVLFMKGARLRGSHINFFVRTGKASSFDFAVWFWTCDSPSDKSDRESRTIFIFHSFLVRSSILYTLYKSNQLNHWIMIYKFTLKYQQYFTLNNDCKKCRIVIDFRVLRELQQKLTNWNYPVHPSFFLSERYQWY